MIQMALKQRIVHTASHSSGHDSQRVWIVMVFCTRFFKWEGTSDSQSQLTRRNEHRGRWNATFYSRHREVTTDMHKA